VTQIFHNGQQSHVTDRKIFEVMTSTLPKGTLGSVASLSAATLYPGNPDRNHKLWNIVSSERYILHIQALLECDSTKKFSETDIFNILEFLIDNIFALFGGRVFQQTVGIPNWYKLCSSSRRLVPLFL
jgi:hypothetical protein